MINLNDAKQILISGLDFLKSLGFREPTTSIEKSKLLGESLLVIYTSVTTQRQIEVSFAPTKADRSATISMFICDSSGDRFSIEDWIAEKAPNVRLQFLASKPSVDERIFLDRFCSECKKILEGSLRGTVEGDEWDAVALNWKGYR
jgi:hypothetical protein